jgi:hypothetical protein
LDGFKINPRHLSKAEPEANGWPTFIATILVPQKKKGDMSSAVESSCSRGV